jgi:hypothetical protein
MTDWGDAILNEQGRVRTWPLAPEAPPLGMARQAQAVTQADTLVPIAPSGPSYAVPLRSHDTGVRILPPPGEEA